MTFILELKEAVSQEEWRELLSRLFQSKSTRFLRRELQLSEGMYEQIMTEIEASPNIYELRKYEKELRKVFPERVRDLMLKLLDVEMRHASSRSAYVRIIQLVKQLYGYPEGRNKAVELAGIWRKTFPRRSALLEELSKAKL